MILFYQSPKLMILFFVQTQLIIVTINSNYIDITTIIILMIIDAHLLVLDEHLTRFNL